MDKSKIIKYYDYTLPFYKVFWHGESRGIHYGLWDKNTKNLKEALLNTNKFLAEKVNIKAGELVLDAGCGVGGSAFWIAKNSGAKVIGISISRKQVEKAKELSKRYNLEKLTEFYEKDYLNTGFANEYFDVVWAIESVCHADSKEDFLKEVFRILKKGGRIIISDGFIGKPTKSDLEKEFLKDFLDGLAVPDLETIDNFKNLLEEVGFKNIEVFDKTEEIMPSSLKMHKMSSWSFPLSKLTEKLKLTPDILTKNNKAGISQYYLFKDRLLEYCVFSAKK